MTYVYILESEHECKMLNLCLNVLSRKPTRITVISKLAKYFKTDQKYNIF